MYQIFSGKFAEIIRSQPSEIYWHLIGTVYRMAKGKIHIGTSGWSYSDWRSIYYPPKTKSTDYLVHYSKDFDCAEINSSFYSLPRVATVQNWVDKTPDHFRFCAKMSRYLTQMKRLRDPEQPLEKFFTAMEPLGEKLAYVLFQLPPSLKFDEQVVTYLFDLLRRDYRHYHFALEARHASWLEDLPLSLLREYGIPLVISQSGVGYPYLESDLHADMYLRFHGPKELFSSRYSDEMLQQYADKIKLWTKEGHNVWIFFNNTMGSNGLDNARTLKSMLGL